VNRIGYCTAHPHVELVPLPACAQFPNVIESVFSGMAREIINKQRLESADAAKGAIDRYFRERNEHFREHPQRAGKKIWRKERVPSTFSDAQNCFDDQSILKLDRSTVGI
jgi:hypothetical protein